MVGIAEEPPRQLAPSVGIAMTEFCYPGGIYCGHQQLSNYISSFRLKIITKLGDRRNQVRFDKAL
jgi:hypothetical protein